MSKRRRVGEKSQALVARFHDKKLDIINFGSTLEENGTAVPLPSSALPLLGGAFARAFLGRNLSRKTEN